MIVSGIKNHSIFQKKQVPKQSSKITTIIKTFTHPIMGTRKVPTDGGMPELST